MRALVLVVALGTGAAQAQGGVAVDFGDGATAVAGFVYGSAVVTTVFTGVVSTRLAVKGERAWSLLPGVLVGSLNLAGGIYGMVENVHRIDGGFALAAGHALFGLWNLVMPMVALVRSGGSDATAHSAADRISPVVLSGRTASGTGKRWTGLGLQVAL